jgi:hypothetical protein
MSIEFRCVACNHKLSAENELAGAHIACSKCHQEVGVPQAFTQPTTVPAHRRSSAANNRAPNGAMPIALAQPLRIVCPNGHRLKAQPESIGQTMTCPAPGCGAKVLVSLVPRVSEQPLQRLDVDWIHFVRNEPVDLLLFEDRLEIRKKGEQSAFYTTARKADDVAKELWISWKHILHAEGGYQFRVSPTTIDVLREWCPLGFAAASARRFMPVWLVFVFALNVVGAVALSQDQGVPVSTVIGCLASLVGFVVVLGGHVVRRVTSTRMFVCSAVILGIAACNLLDFSAYASSSSRGRDAVGVAASMALGLGVCQIVYFVVALMIALDLYGYETVNRAKQAA